MPPSQSSAHGWNRPVNGRPGNRLRLAPKDRAAPVQCEAARSASSCSPKRGAGCQACWAEIHLGLSCRARPEIVFSVGHESGFHGISLNVPYVIKGAGLPSIRVEADAAVDPWLVSGCGARISPNRDESRDESRLSRLDSLRHYA